MVVVRMMLSSPLLLLSLPLLTVSTWTPKCDGSSEPKDLHGRSYALLHAHRLFQRGAHEYKKVKTKDKELPIVPLFGQY